MPSANVWKAWSIPVDVVSMRHKLCGLLNRLTRNNFDSVCCKIVEWAIAVERTGDLHTLAVLVHDVFDRGVSDHVRCRLYASLCQRVIDELEGERSRWKKVDVYHIGNLVHSFETDIRLLAHDEFHRMLSTEDPSKLSASMSFAGELLVHGVILSEDLQDIVDILFKYVESDDEERVVALCRLLGRLVSAFDAYRVLASLNIVERVERALKIESLSQRTRYLLMSMLEQVVFPRPQDAFSSIRERVEVYGVDLDDSDAGSIGEEEEELEDDRVRRTCMSCATTFLLKHDVSAVQSLFGILRPIHHTVLVQEFITAALHGNDVADAATVGSILSAIAGDSLLSALTAQLVWLEDTTLDVPRAPQLMASLLHGAGLNLPGVEQMATQVIPSSSPILQSLLTGMRVLQDSPDSTTDTQDHSLEGRRLNRFERDF
ncbi:hypothetical protein NM688_g4430 [Phlebia brevispora]|uniref:Uncharacterized protein n=1 Tax=Phlebia brevispora TaxID=194682 RepID=A0ACC1T351_9APHY|nr:hypothetical protein NM688_g4430 [Phlebia brevispora]